MNRCRVRSMIAIVGQVLARSRNDSVIIFQGIRWSINIIQDSYRSINIHILIFSHNERTSFQRSKSETQILYGLQNQNEATFGTRNVWLSLLIYSQQNVDLKFNRSSIKNIVQNNWDLAKNSVEMAIINWKLSAVHM